MVVMNRHGELVIVDETGREREHNRLVYGAILKVKDGDQVKPGSSSPSGTSSRRRSSPRPPAS
jgi:hypothetical protein